MTPTCSRCGEPFLPLDYYQTICDDCINELVKPALEQLPKIEKEQSA